jgi:hypothetical protein
MGRVRGFGTREFKLGDDTVTLSGDYYDKDIKPENIKRDWDKLLSNNLCFKNLADNPKYDYVVKAKELAKRIKSGTVTDEDFQIFDAVCRLAAGDRDNFKGSYIVSIFMELFQAENSQAERFRGTGKYCTLNETQIEKIIKHDNELYDEDVPKETQKKFCADLGISKNLYNRVVREEFSHDRDNERVREIKKRLGVVDDTERVCTTGEAD